MAPQAKIANPVVGRIYTQADGVCPSLEYRVRFFYDDDSGKKVQISPWHDVPFRNPDGMNVLQYISHSCCHNSVQALST